MDRESFRQERRALCSQLELSRQQADEWMDQKESPSIVKTGLKFLIKHGLVSLMTPTPLSLARLFFK